jgi:hypothetical protein
VSITRESKNNWNRYFSSSTIVRLSRFWLRTRYHVIILGPSIHALHLALRSSARTWIYFAFCGDDYQMSSLRSIRAIVLASSKPSSPETVQSLTP